MISSREFRENQKKFLNMVDNNEIVIIQRGKDKDYVLSPASEGNRYFMNPKVKEHIMKGIAEQKAEENKRVGPKDLNQLFG